MTNSGNGSRSKRRIGLAVGAMLLCLAGGNPANGQSGNIDLINAVIVHSATNPRQARAAEFLQYEIERRTGIRLAMGNSRPADRRPAIVAGTVGVFPKSFAPPVGLSVPDEAEGYVIWVDDATRSSPTVCLEGHDDRGMMFAVGGLIRLLNLASNYISLASDVRVSTAPTEAIRAQQMIYSPQSKDGFVNWRDAAQKEQQIRDLVLFGANGFEPRPARGVDQFLQDLGLDLFVVVSCQNLIDDDKLTDDQIKQRYSDLVGVDHFTTYGGDASGSRPPQEVFPAMQRVVPLVLASHPGAKWWYSNQCLENHAVAYDDYIFNYLNTWRPRWLYGMVYGPWTRRGIPEIRASLPSEYRIRHYPDICHVRWCQYPIPKWDQVWAQVWPRNQSIYVMPRMMAAIHQATREGTVGFLPYNHTGSYNDLNKFVWTAKGWNPEAKVDDILYDYGKVFFAYDFLKPPEGGLAGAGTDSNERLIDAGARAVARGLELLEDNWTGRLATNTSCEAALKLWKNIAICMGGAGRNRRLEMYLYRAFLDAQVKRKYDAEMKCEQEAYEALKQAGAVGVASAVANARAALARVDTEFQSKDSFKEELQSWGLTSRFGDLDTILANIYSPLSDRRWLEKQLETARSLEDIKRIVNYEDPGPGGFYDNLGAEDEEPHLVRPKSWEQDPGFVHSPIEWVDHDPGSARRHSQLTHAVCRYDTPLQMRWEGLDPRASYHIRVVYLGPFNPRIICETDDGQLIHGPRGNTGATPVSYRIPQSSTRDGVLGLRWRLANNVRGVSVTEIWLIKD